MEMSEFMLWKAGVMVALAFVWGVFCGLTGRPLSPGQSDRQTEQDQPAQIGGPER